MRAVFFLPLFLVACGIEHDLHGQPPGEDAPTETEPAPEPEPEPEAVAGEPVADAGADGEWSPLDTVQLDGTASYDPDGLEIVEMKWTVVSIPAGSTATLDGTSKPKPSFFADLAGDYVFELTVMNEDGVWDSTPDTVVITTTPLDGFYVELSWDKGNDLDLHFLQEGSDLFTFQDTNFCNDNPNWGDSGPDDDPSLDWDAVYGYGPETATIDAPRDGAYNVQVHYYGEDGFPSCSGGCATTTATVNIYLGGVKAATFTQEMSKSGQVWDVATIEWPIGQITEVAEFYTTNKDGC